MQKRKLEAVLKCTLQLHRYKKPASESRSDANKHSDALQSPDEGLKTASYFSYILHHQLLIVRDKLPMHKLLFFFWVRGIVAFLTCILLLLSVLFWVKNTYMLPLGEI